MGADITFEVTGAQAPLGLVGDVTRMSGKIAIWHDFYELVHVTGGRAVHRLNGVAQELVPGSTILLTPPTSHELESGPEGPSSYVNVVVDAALPEGRMDGPLPAGLGRSGRSAGPVPPGWSRRSLQCILIELGRRTSSSSSSSGRT